MRLTTTPYSPEEVWKYTPSEIKNILIDNDFQISKSPSLDFKNQLMKSYDKMDQQINHDFISIEQLWLEFQSETLDKSLHLETSGSSPQREEKLLHFNQNPFVHKFLSRNTSSLYKIQIGHLKNKYLKIDLSAFGLDSENLPLLEIEVLENVQVTIEFIYSDKEIIPGLLGRAIFIELKPGANLKIKESVLYSSQLMRCLKVILSENAHFKHLIHSSTQNYFRNEIQIDLNGPHSSAFLGGSFLQYNKSINENNIWINHNTSDSYSNQLYKTILGDEAVHTSLGHIHISQLGQKTESHQLLKSLILSKKAQVNCKPYLDIHCDDVKATHGAAISSLDTEELFYLESRGIKEQEAKKILESGFLKEVEDQWNQ